MWQHWRRQPCLWKTNRGVGNGWSFGFLPTQTMLGLRIVENEKITVISIVKIMIIKKNMENRAFFLPSDTFLLVSDGALNLSELPSHSGCTIGLFFTLMYKGLFLPRLYLITATWFCGDLLSRIHRVFLSGTPEQTWLFSLNTQIWRERVLKKKVDLMAELSTFSNYHKVYDLSFNTSLLIKLLRC